MHIFMFFVEKYMVTVKVGNVSHEQYD